MVEFRRRRATTLLKGARSDNGVGNGRKLIKHFYLVFD
jgi:hypothetical protein